MSTVRKAGRCLIFSKCACIPPECSNETIQRAHYRRMINPQNVWDFVKDKLGMQKREVNKNMTHEEESSYLDREHVELPIHTNSTEETWKPGYRGRTENKRC